MVSLVRVPATFYTRHGTTVTHAVTLYHFGVADLSFCQADVDGNEDSIPDCSEGIVETLVENVFQVQTVVHSERLQQRVPGFGDRSAIE